MQQINKRTITLNDKLFALCYILLTLSSVFLIDMKFSDLTPVFLFLPIVVVCTFIFHELIHVFFFIFFDERAKICVIRDRDLKACIMYQSNSDVNYSKKQTLIILLAPCLLITAMSVAMIPHSGIWNLTFTVNMVLNCIGSVTDFVIAHRLIKIKQRDIRISYCYDKNIGVSMIIRN